VSFLLRVALGLAVGLASLIAPVGAFVSPALAASAPKVVIIVGPVGGTTPSYRSDADAAATEALKFTPNVVKLYSPNATWETVKPALQGASIVIYMGHGSGFPSPYSTTLMPDRQNGLGLNPSAGVDDSATKYWGEQYLASDVRLAPNAVVILGHLCYASGSSESGRPDPTVSEAQQRVDNFAAGFLAAGARAVIAEAYGGASAKYVNALFTAHSTIGSIWASSFSNQGNAYSFASTRTPGMTVQMDPDRSSGKYYRAITGDMSLSSDAVISGDSSGGTGTPADPAPSAIVGGSTPTPTPTPTPTQTPAAAIVSTVDDATVDLTSLGMSLSSISAPAAFSPNGDGLLDTFQIRAHLSSPGIWQLTITDRFGTVFAGTGGAGDSIDFAWDGTSGGGHLPDGLYLYRVAATDLKGNALDRTARVRIDTTAPTFTPTGATASSTTFSPNGDGSADTWIGTFATNESVVVSAKVLSSDGATIRTLTAASPGGTMTVSWDGRTDAGSDVPDGQYVIVLTVRDAAGNAGTPMAVSASVYRALSRVGASATVFYPQDNDAYAKSTKLSFVLAQPAAVTWSVVNAKGQAVATRYQNTALGAGSRSWVWTGLDAVGRPVAPGTYTAVVTAGNGSLATTTRTVLTVAAFRITVRPTVAIRGQNITVTAVSAEPLGSNPRLTISQPGVAARSVAMVKVATNTYRVTTRLSSSGSAGTLTLKVAGTDTARGVNIAKTTIKLR